jgi:hypothetical protein
MKQLIKLCGLRLARVPKLGALFMLLKNEIILVNSLVDNYISFVVKV